MNVKTLDYGKDIKEKLKKIGVYFCNPLENKNI